MIQNTNDKKQYYEEKKFNFKTSMMLTKKLRNLKKDIKY